VPLHLKIELEKINAKCMISGFKSDTQYEVISQNKRKWRMTFGQTDKNSFLSKIGCIP